ncbi:hypothetical protein QUF31_20935 [Dickeya chrysanthemi]|nr:hypothetical protein [Dickeya chrysanthemi]WJM85480.1 hypothetical protein QUF31_20935 [Dickeya chrysanthemi]
MAPPPSRTVSVSVVSAFSRRSLPAASASGPPALSCAPFSTMSCPACSVSPLCALINPVWPMSVRVSDPLPRPSLACVCHWLLVVVLTMSPLTLASVTVLPWMVALRLVRLPSAARLSAPPAFSSPPSLLLRLPPPAMLSTSTAVIVPPRLSMSPPALRLTLLATMRLPARLVLSACARYSFGASTVWPPTVMFSHHTMLWLSPATCAGLRLTPSCRFSRLFSAAALSISCCICASSDPTPFR